VRLDTQHFYTFYPATQAESDAWLDELEDAVANFVDHPARQEHVPKIKYWLSVRGYVQLFEDILLFVSCVF